MSRRRAKAPAPPAGAALLLGLAGARGERAAKLLAALEVDAMSPELAQLLLLGALRYRTAGGIWTPEAFAALSPALQALVYEAGEKYDAARATTYGDAARGGFAAARVAATFDGGASLEELAYQTAAERAHQKTLELCRGMGLFGAAPAARGA